MESQYANRVTQLLGDSAEFDWDEFSPFDFILIDGCHTYEYAVADTRNALRVVRPGGVIVWHDYGMLEDVSLAVDEIAGRMKVHAIQGLGSQSAFPRRLQPDSVRVAVDNPPGMRAPSSTDFVVANCECHRVNGIRPARRAAGSS